MRGFGKTLFFLVVAIVGIWIVASLMGLEFSLLWTLVLSVGLTLMFHLVTRPTGAR